LQFERTAKVLRSNILVAIFSPSPTVNAMLAIRDSKCVQF
jgi:hypothetical protein